MFLCLCIHVYSCVSKLPSVLSWRVFATFWVRELKLLSAAAAVALQMIPNADVECIIVVCSWLDWGVISPRKMLPPKMRNFC